MHQVRAAAKSGLMSVVLLSLVTAAAPAAVTPITQNFSSDPGWTTVGQTGTDASSFGYNSADGNVSAPGNVSGPGSFNRRPTWDYYGTPLASSVTDADSFTFQADLQLLSAGSVNGSALHVGLFNSFSAAPTSDAGTNAVLLTRGWAGTTPGTHYYKFHIFDSAGVEMFDAGRLNLGTSTAIESFHTLRLDYDGATRVVTVYGDGALRATSAPLSSSQHFSLNLLAVSNAFNSGGTFAGSGRVDNISLAVPEPTSLAAVSLAGAMVLARRRRSH